MPCSIVEDPRGRDYFLYHAYSAQTSVFTGREALLDQVEWTEDAWPVINHGQGPSRSAASPFGRPKGPVLTPGWEWPWNQPPEVRPDPDHPGWTLLRGILARDVPSADYTVTVAAMQDLALVAYGNRENSLGISFTAKGLEVWRLQNGIKRPTRTAPAPNPSVVYLRMEVQKGREFHFGFSTDGTHWQDLKETVAPETLPPWDLGVVRPLPASTQPDSKASC